MQKLRRIKDAIVAVAFLDGTYQAYTGNVSEIKVYKEDEDTYSFPESINTEMIVELHFPQGFTINNYDGNPSNLLPEANIEGD